MPVNQYTIGTLDGRIGQYRVDALSAALSEDAWSRRSAGDGAKGPRLYDWARVPIRPLLEPDRYWLLIRRRLTDGELAHYLCFTPPRTALQELVAVAGRRWAIEESLPGRQGRGRPGPLPSPPLRRLVPAHHPRLLGARLPDRHPRHRERPKSAGPDLRGELTELSVPEIRHLVSRLVWAVEHHPDQVLHWSHWRRRHQARARRCHYATRERRLQVRL